jgi:uncharacterized membrane protein YkoI
MHYLSNKIIYFLWIIVRRFIEMVRTTDKVLLGVLILGIIGMSTLLVSAGSFNALFGEEGAKQIALQLVPGEVIEVETENNVYEVDITTDSGEKEVKIDQQGQVISVEDEETDVPITGSALGKAKAAALAVVCEGDPSCDARVTDTEVGDEESYYEVEVQYNGKEIDVQLDESFNFVGYD